MVLDGLIYPKAIKKPLGKRVLDYSFLSDAVARVSTSILPVIQSNKILPVMTRTTA